MSLENFATKLVAGNDFVKVSFGGFAGSGKTRTASEFIIGLYPKMNIKKPLLIIDNEKGSRFLIPMFKKAGIETYIKESVSLADTLEAFAMLNRGEIGCLFIDSLTKIWYKYINDYKMQNKKTFMTLQDWGKILPSWQEKFADAFVQLKGNCIFTGRGGYTYDMEENEETHKKEFIKSGVKMKMAGETPFEPDLNVWMDSQQEMNKEGKPIIWRECLIMKDRSGLIDGKIFINPTFKDFEPVVDYLLNIEKGEVAGITDNTNLAPSEIYSGEKQKREIEVEKIAGLFQKFGFGTSKEDKQIKTLVQEKIFNTLSEKEFEKYNSKDLEIRRKNLEILLNILSNSLNKIEAIKEYTNSEA